MLFKWRLSEDGRKNEKEERKNGVERVFLFFRFSFFVYEGESLTSRWWASYRNIKPMQSLSKSPASRTRMSRRECETWTWTAHVDNEGNWFLRRNLCENMIGYHFCGAYSLQLRGEIHGKGVRMADSICWHCPFQ